MCVCRLLGSNGEVTGHGRRLFRCPSCFVSQLQARAHARAPVRACLPVFVWACACLCVFVWVSAFVLLLISACNDVIPNWVDTRGFTCRDYEENNWCTASGGYGSGWSSGWGMFSNYAVNGFAATDACCKCGAGLWAFMCVARVHLLSRPPEHPQCTSIFCWC